MDDKAAKERQRERKGKQAGAKVEKLPHLEKARDAAGKAVGPTGAGMRDDHHPH